MRLNMGLAGVEQTSKGKDVHGGDAKIRPQGLVDGLRDDLRITDGVKAVLVHPQHAGPRRLFVPQRRHRGVPEVV